MSAPGTFGSSKRISAEIFYDLLEVEAEVFADHFAWVKRAAFAYFETLADFGISLLEV